MAKNIRKRWYSPQGQGQLRSRAHEQSSGTRRLASLLILLVLVLILIQQTSDVRKVEQVATAIGLLQNESMLPPSQTETGFNARLNSAVKFKDRSNDDTMLLEQVAMETDSLSVRTYQHLWKSLLKNAPVLVVDAMAQKLFARRSLEEQENTKTIRWTEVQKWYAEAKLKLEKWAEIESQNAASRGVELESTKSESALPPFVSWLQEQQSWFADSSMKDHSDPQDDFFRGLSIALDEKLLEQPDWIPFVRSWQRIGAIRELLASRIASPHHFPKIEVSQLLTASHVHRGRPICVDGTIYQADTGGSTSEPGFPKINYQAFWLRPDDFSNQPIKVYIPAEYVDARVKLEKDYHITLTGLLFKRITYMSQRGEESAPLLLAANVTPFGATETDATDNPFLVLNRFAREKLKWEPPVDTKTPFSNVLPRIQRALESVDDEMLATGFNGMEATDAVKPILELERLAPELEILLKTRSDWPVSEVATLSRITGTVTRVQRIPINSQLAAALDRSYVYRCDVEIGTDSIDLLSAAVPSAWLQANEMPLEAIRQPCEVDGIIWRRAGKESLGWARAIKWKLAEGQLAGDSVACNPNISEPLKFLMRNGWDLAWIDRVRELQMDPIKPLSLKEIEPYFALMELAKRTPYLATKPSTEPASSEGSIVDLIEAFRQKKANVRPAIERMSMNMRIVRVSRVHVEDSDQTAILGSDRYFQIDAMADIGNRTYEIKADKDPIVYHKEYPVTCVAIDVPSWLMGVERIAERDSGLNTEHVWYPRMKATASGWFYRFWSYKTHEISQSLGANNKQIGPLIVLDSIRLGITTKDENSSNAIANFANSMAVAIGVLGTIGIWWFVRRSAKPKRGSPTRRIS